MLEKDICLKVVEYLRSNKAEFGSGEGEWQCIIGKNLAATLNYDLHMLTFFDLPEFGYSVLVFKSGWAVSKHSDWSFVFLGFINFQEDLTFYLEMFDLGPN